MTKNESYVPLKSLEPALDHLCKFYPSILALSRDMGVSHDTPKNWVSRSVVSVNKKQADKILKLYEVYKDQEPDPETLENSTWAKRQKRAGLPDGGLYPGGKLRPLEVGKSYKIKSKDGRVNEGAMSGRVVQDLGRFYLVDCGNYKSTILKNDLCKDDFVIAKV